MPLHRGEHSYVKISSNWSPLRTCFIKIEWCKCTLSNNPSKSTLCVLVTCLKFLGFVLCWPFGSLPHCLRKCIVGLSEDCLECWAERGQLIQIHNCKNVNETEWLFRVRDAQGFRWLAYCVMFSMCTPNIEELANHPHVNLRQEKWYQTLHCCEKLRFASCTSTKWEQTCVWSNTHSEPPDVELESRESRATEASWNEPSLQSSIWFPTWQNCIFFGHTVVTYQS